jgi:hypothetical protein
MSDMFLWIVGGLVAVAALILLLRSDAGRWVLKAIGDLLGFLP